MCAKLKIIPFTLRFKSPIRTSRGEMDVHRVWFFCVDTGSKWAVGECAPLGGLSPDYGRDFLGALEELDGCYWEGVDPSDYVGFPAIRFALEQCSLMLSSDQEMQVYRSGWLTNGQRIPINGLLWMGDRDHLMRQIYAKLDEGYPCLKMKVAALDWHTELSVLRYIRSKVSSDDLELRVDANGGFRADEATARLKDLSSLGVHSIEQPIAQGQREALHELCLKEIVPIALDEELIGHYSKGEKADLLAHIAPQYIILKPTLLGGFAECEEWISLAEERNVGWWVTSALESNVGLSAIAQWTATLDTGMMYQGLGTGALYENNIDSPLIQRAGGLYYDSMKKWNLNMFCAS